MPKISGHTNDTVGNFALYNNAEGTQQTIIELTGDHDWPVRRVYYRKVLKTGKWGRWRTPKQGRDSQVHVSDMHEEERRFNSGDLAAETILDLI